jgi:hypothetical protein
MWNVESDYTLVATTRKMPRGSMDLEAISFEHGQEQILLEAIIRSCII